MATENILSPKVKGDLNKVVPFSCGNITIKKGRQILKNQRPDNTTWLVPKAGGNFR